MPLKPFILLLVFTASFATGRYFIIDPLDKTSWRVGSPATVRWKITPEGPKATSLTVDLLAGPLDKPQWVATICDKLDPTATSCTWPSVPSYLTTLPSGYSIRIAYNDAQRTFDYSPRFQINGTKAGSDDSPPRAPAPEACVGTECNDGSQASTTGGKDPRSPSSGSSSSLLSILVLFATFLVSLCIN